MKIIIVDNFNNESVSDKLVAENVPDIWAKRIVELLNDKYSGGFSSFYAKVVADDYELYEFTP